MSAAGWSNISQAMSRGYAMGRDTGGKLSGLGNVIGKVADRLRSQRETGEAMQTQLDLLGKTEKIKAMYHPEEYKPLTKEAALEYEGAKAGIKATPTKFELQKMANDEAYRQMGGSAMAGIISPDNPESLQKYRDLAQSSYQGLLKEYGYTIPEVNPTTPILPKPVAGGDKRDAYNALRSSGVSATEAKKRLGVQ